MAKVEKELVVSNENGIHARPAAMFVKVSNRFKSEIFVKKDGERVNGKSIMGIMMLAAEFGSTLMITAIGDDAEEAVSALEKLFLSKFES